MIKTEYPFEGNEEWIRTYTDLEGKVLLQKETGFVYGSEVIDVYPCQYTYEEVDDLNFEEPEKFEQEEEQK